MDGRDGSTTISLNYETEWARSGSTYARGSAFIDGDYYSTSGLAKGLSEVNSLDAFKDILVSLRGFFAISHLPASLSSQTELIDYIFDWHYQLWRSDTGLERALKRRIAGRPPNRGKDLAAEYAHWEFLERQGILSGTSPRCMTIFHRPSGFRSRTRIS